MHLLKSVSGCLSSQTESLSKHNAGERGYEMPTTTLTELQWLRWEKQHTLAGVEVFLSEYRYTNRVSLHENWEDVFSRMVPTPSIRPSQRSDLNANTILYVSYIVTSFSFQSGLGPGDITTMMGSRMKRLMGGGRLTWRRKSAVRGSVPIWSITWRAKVSLSWGYFV